MGRRERRAMRTAFIVLTIYIIVVWRIYHNIIMN
jgi:hypothetical protein